MIQIQLQPELEAQLAAEAHARGMDLSEYIVEKLEQSRAAEQSDRHSVAEAINRIRELRRGNTLGGLSNRELLHEGHKY